MGLCRVAKGVLSEGSSESRMTAWLLLQKGFEVDIAPVQFRLLLPTL